MGASSSSIKYDNLSSKQKIGLWVCIAILSAIVIVLIILASLGKLNPPSSNISTNAPAINSSTNPSTKPSTNNQIVPVGGSALFSPTNDGQKWTKVFDSMQGPTKCVIDFSSTPQISPANIRKIVKYQIDNNMLPIDNPFKGIIETPVTGCSPDGTRLVLTLDLSNYGGSNPFHQGDVLYIFGVQGETTSNSISAQQVRYVYATQNENPKFVLYNQIMLSSVNPCDYTGKCVINNTSPMFASGTYTGGGIVRYVGNALFSNGFINQRPQIMFYLYMSYKNYSFTWPFAQITASQAYNLYSSYYNGFLQWLANLPQTCTQPGYIDNTNLGFISGPVTISGGSGTGMQMYIISTDILGSTGCVLIVTNDGTGYKDQDSVTVSQGTITTSVVISINTNCSNQTANGNIYLSYTTTQQQFKNLINYAVSIDPTINTIVLNSNNLTVVPDNYNVPNITVLFVVTTPDTTTLTGNNYMNTEPICVCNNPPLQDQDTPKNFFPNKISQCINQIIYTNTNTSYDFINNAATIIGTSCNVTTC